MAARRVSLLLTLGLAGCAYFNTFYNAEVAYREGLKLKATSPVQARDKFELAIEKSAIVVKAWPTSRWVDDALFLIAMSYYQMGESEKALRRFDDYLVYFPDTKRSTEINFYRGQCFRALKEKPQAVAILQEVASGSRKWRERALRATADAQLEDEDYGAAIVAFERLLEAFPRSPARAEVELKLGDAYAHEGDYAKAARAYEWHLKRTYTSHAKAETELKLAEIYLNAKELARARAELNKVIGQYPDLEPKAYLLLGKACLAEEKKNEAVGALCKVTGFELKAEAYYLVGRVREEEKDFTRASAYYDSAQSSNPSSEFGLLALKRRTFLDRLTTPDTTQAKDPAQAQFQLAEVYYLSLEQPEEALIEYGKVVTLYPKSPYAPKALLAQAYILQNVLRRDGYRALYEQLTTQYPDTEYARQAQAALEALGTNQGSGQKQD